MTENLQSLFKSLEILESENLKEQLKEVKETLKMQLVKELISENH